MQSQNQEVKKRGNKLPKAIENGWVGVPRRIKDDYLAGLISFTEFSTIVYLYLSCNTFAQCHVFTRALSADILGAEEKYDYMGEILRSLKAKKYIWFESRQGKQGTFIVRVNNFLMKGGVYYMFDDMPKAELEVHEVDMTVQKVDLKVMPIPELKVEPIDLCVPRSDNNKKKTKKKIKNVEELREHLDKEVFKKK